MTVHSHRFVEEYDGLVGFGLDRETNESTVIYYLQKFSDDRVMAVLRRRMSDEDLDVLFNTLAGLLKKCLAEQEYHDLFLKDGDEPAEVSQAPNTRE